MSRTHAGYRRSHCRCSSGYLHCRSARLPHLRPNPTGIGCNEGGFGCNEGGFGWNEKEQALIGMNMIGSLMPRLELNDSIDSSDIMI